MKIIFTPLIILSLLIAGCAERSPIADEAIREPESSVFIDNFDEVWRAIQLALRKYPVHLNNIESGILETDFIKGDKLYAEPVEGKTKPGMRYKLVVRAVRGKRDNKSAVKVVCTKNAEIQPDFFTGFQPIPSNGLEEKTILYRIGRYLEMEKILTKAGSGNSAGQN